MGGREEGLIELYFEADPGEKLPSCSLSPLALPASNPSAHTLAQAEQTLALSSLPFPSPPPILQTAPGAGLGCMQELTGVKEGSPFWSAII